MSVKGIRGATTVDTNNAQEIIEATEKLLTEMIEKNSLIKANIVSIFFTMTQDLNAVFPAKAARNLGLSDVPLLCATEIEVPEALEKCIRILFHVNVADARAHIGHVYLNDAIKLRPDLEGQ